MFYCVIDSNLFIAILWGAVKSKAILLYVRLQPGIPAHGCLPFRPPAFLANRNQVYSSLRPYSRFAPQPLRVILLIDPTRYTCCTAPCGLHSAFRERWLVMQLRVSQPPRGSWVVLGGVLCSWNKVPSVYFVLTLSKEWCLPTTIFFFQTHGLLKLSSWIMLFCNSENVFILWGKLHFPSCVQLSLNDSSHCCSAKSSTFTTHFCSQILVGRRAHYNRLGIVTTYWSYMTLLIGPSSMLMWYMSLHLLVTHRTCCMIHHLI